MEPRAPSRMIFTLILAGILLGIGTYSASAEELCDGYEDAPFCQGDSYTIDCAAGPDEGSKEYYESAGGEWWRECVSDEPGVKLCAASEEPVWDEQDFFVGCVGFDGYDPDYEKPATEAGTDPDGSGSRVSASDPGPDPEHASDPNVQHASAERLPATGSGPLALSVAAALALALGAGMLRFARKY